MPTIHDLTAPYESFMRSPRRGMGVCQRCLTFTDGYSICFACGRTQPWLDAIAPISYSVAHEQLHHVLVTYKRLGGPVGDRMRLELAAVLWRYLARHEACLAAEAGVAAFDSVTTVPSGKPERTGQHPLRTVVGELCGPTRERYEDLLVRASGPAAEHDFDPHKFEPSARLSGESVLLVDDTWTTGASAQSAAAALKRAGARKVGLVVVGRHVKRAWQDNGARLAAVAPYDWDACALCSAPASLASAAS